LRRSGRRRRYGQDRSDLEQTSSVDLDDRQQNWRNEGWTPAPVSTAGTTPRTDQQSTNLGTASTRPAANLGAGNVVEEQHIPIVEEQLVVGKREVNRGGARIRTYVKEVPVHEQVSLREEHVSVERVPVTGERLQGQLGADAFQERSIEMTESAEEAVVAKEARVKKSSWFARQPRSMSRPSTTRFGGPRSRSMKARPEPALPWASGRRARSRTPWTDMTIQIGVRSIAQPMLWTASSRSAELTRMGAAPQLGAAPFAALAVAVSASVLSTYAVEK
jgi:stress response protein YsnF